MISVDRDAAQREPVPISALVISAFGISAAAMRRAGLRRQPGIGLAVLLLVLAGQLAVARPARAQDTVQELRLRKVEAEVHALQRQVFPGGDTKFFPQDNAAPPPAPPPVGTPATTPMTDVLTRMDAVEAQVAHLTAQYEELSNRVRQLDGRLSAIAPIAPQPLATPAPASLPAPAAAPAPLAVAPAAPPPAQAAAASTKPSAQRIAAVRAVVKPESADPAEDDYIYGFKLWQAKLFPEATQQLKLFLGKYPRHPRATYARNLLGRALLDDGKPRDAADTFLQNYNADKHGARAADSLLFLAAAMVDLKDANRACIALAEFSDGFKTEATGRLKPQYDDIRASVACN